MQLLTGTFNQIIYSSPRRLRPLQFYSYLLQLEQFLSAVKANVQHGKKSHFIKTDRTIPAADIKVKIARLNVKQPLSGPL